MLHQVTSLNTILGLTHNADHEIIDEKATALFYLF